MPDRMEPPVASAPHQPAKPGARGAAPAFDPRYPENPVLVQVWRGDAVESQHRGAWVVCDSSGTTIDGVGAWRAPVFTRSAVKSLQALPLLETGAAQRFAFCPSLIQNCHVGAGFAHAPDPLEELIDERQCVSQPHQNAGYHVQRRCSCAEDREVDALPLRTWVAGYSCQSALGAEPGCCARLDVLRRVRHPNLVSFYDLVSDGTRWFLTMELVEGVHFLEYVRSRTGQLPVDTDRLRAVARQLAEGISALHASGILHRDLKPSNVLVTSDGRVKILDFGLVADLAPQGNAMSLSSLGTPTYVSPEQSLGSAVTTASDWYSVGTMLFQALTGKAPFTGQIIEVLIQKQTVDPPAASALVPGVPEDLASLATALLSRDPAARPTGPEILGDFAGKRLDYFVTGWGTGGTLTGAGEVIRLARPEVRIIATEPEGAALLSGKPFAPHKIQGWTPDFVPAVLNRNVPDRIVPVADADAIGAARQLAAQEGIFCGISSGGTFAAALKVAREAEPGAVIVAMLPDTGERYLSTALFEGIPDGTDAEP